jgi:hypothetical protein
MFTPAESPDRLKDSQLTHFEIGIGGTVTRLPLPHHRRCGSAYGGSEG